MKKATTIYISPNGYYGVSKVNQVTHDECLFEVFSRNRGYRALPFGTVVFVTQSQNSAVIEASDRENADIMATPGWSRREWA